MSVLACNRHGCDNIMCDRYSFTYGYLCWECYQELVNSGKEISVFMDSMKGTYKQKPADYTIYQNEFPLR